jgi:hypothetical protein
MRISSGFVVSSVVLAILAACSGDDGANANPQCTKKVYDPCRDEHDCDSALCRPLGDNVVCTMLCTPGDDTCPKFKGKAVECNADGLCAPDGATTCVLEDGPTP